MTCELEPGSGDEPDDESGASSLEGVVGSLASPIIVSLASEELPILSKRSVIAFSSA